MVALAAAADKIQVELYYESLCPGCRQAINTSFMTALKTEGFFDMAEVKLYPYGNALESIDTYGDLYHFSCQHGKVECDWNMVEACAQAHISCPYQQGLFIECIEGVVSASGTDYDELTSKCAGDLGINDDVAATINACHANSPYGSAEGNALMHTIA